MTLKDELFGDKEGVYKKLASDLNGSYSPGEFENPVRVNVPYKNWIITADTFVTIDIISPARGNPFGGNSEHTRILAPFRKKGDFSFAITTSTALDSFAKLFGAQDIKVGDPDFDKLFTIKGNDETKVRQIFENPEIKRFLIELENVNLLLRDQEGYFGTHLPENINELFFKADDVIIDEKKLKLLVHLFSLLLDQLATTGNASPENPGFKLV